MKSARAISLGCLLAAACCSASLAKTVNLTTSRKQTPKWTVAEFTNGQKVSAPAVFNTDGFGTLPNITIPFTNCDGYWQASRQFHVPVGATNLVLKVTAVDVDDRSVIKLNGVRLVGVGITTGKGDMQFHDPGKNVPYRFKLSNGPVSYTDTADLRPGRNEIKVIVNNTGNGINGSLEPVNGGDPSYFGIRATVTYTP